MTASAATLNFGQPDTFTASVTDPAGDPTPTGGTVTFRDAGTAIGTAALVNGQAAFTTTTLPVGAHAITASYGGTADFAPSRSGVEPTSAVSTIGSGLSRPARTAVNAAGDVLIADSGNNRVVEVQPDGTQTTVASGLNNPLDVAVDSSGDVFIADTGNNRVVEVQPGGAQTMVGSGLSIPYGVAVDSLGDVFIADTGNNRVVEVQPDGAQTTIASGIVDPTGVAVDSLGDVFVAEFYNNQVVEVQPDGTQTTVGSGLNQPAGVAVDGFGDVFIADFGDSRALEFKADGTQTSIASGLLNPTGVAVDSLGDVFIADYGNSRVVEATAGVPVTVNAPSLVVDTLADSPTPGFTTLRQALANAATLGGSQTITFAPGLSGTITLGGDLEISSNVSIDGPGAPLLTVSGGGPSSNFSVFIVDSSVTVSISGLTIANGYTTGDGGGIFNDSGTLTVSSSTIAHNSAEYGGGIWSDGTLTVTSSTITSNSADIGGGAIAGAGTMTTVTSSTITSNSAEYGGGITSDGTLTVTDSTIADNSAYLGGGMDNDSGQMTATGSTLSGNTATGPGGGIFNDYALETVTNCTIADNSAGTSGGGISTLGLLTAVNSSIAYNNTAATGEGGGLDVYTGTVTLDNTIVALNTDGTGGAAPADDISLFFPSGPIGTVSSASANNLIGTGGSGGLINGGNGNLVGVNPLLAPLGNYGGPTQTMALLPGSPAIDAGSTALAVDAQGNPLTTDQRGMPRVVGAAVDIGAFESSGFTLAVAAGNNQSTGVNTAFPTALQVTVTPNNPGDPVDGGVVTFTPPASGASTALSPSGPVEITSGTASVTATANNTVGGPYAVTASAAGASPVSCSLTNTSASSVYVVTNTNDSGPGSLRQAILYADANDSVAVTISFNIPTTDPGYANGVFTIQPLSQLPVLIQNITIDGTTQTAYTGNTNPYGPVIVLNGAKQASGDGLELDDNNTVKDLDINGFQGTGVNMSYSFSSNGYTNNDNQTQNKRNILIDLCTIDVHKCFPRSRTFYYPEAPTPVRHCRAFCSIPCPLSWFDGPRGSGHPDPDFRIFSLQHSQQPCSRSTNRRKAPCHGFHDSNR